MVVNANDNNTSEGIIDDSIQDEVYVSLEGDDFTGNGSLESPYSSLNYAVDLAKNNSKIILSDGVYSGDSNTNIVINKDLIIESRLNNVVINGEGKNYFFKVNNGSSLILNNIKFINGFTDSYLQLSAFNNQGKLTVNNSSFVFMNTIMGTFLNEGELIINNSSLSSSYSKNLAQIVTNVGKCTIFNSKFSNVEATSSSLPSIYNYGDINIIGSRIESLISNNQYDEFNFKTSMILIQNASLGYLNLEYANCRINNSILRGNVMIEYSNLFINDSHVYFKDSYSIVSVKESNITAIHSVFESKIYSNHNILNITYSIILKGMSGGGKGDYLYGSYNWWGVNSGPLIEYFNNRSIENWAVLQFDVEDGNLSVGTDSKFISKFKWSDGNSIYEFKENEYLPSRQIKFESQSGVFLKTTSNFINNFENYLIGNKLDCRVYCIVDNQRCSLEIGNGLSEYTYFVAPWGNNSPDAGTYDNPFKTIKYAISQTVNGNTICLLDGIYKNNANSEITIDKNVTFVGLGDVTFSRANDKIMFYIKEWGNLIIKNVKVTVSNQDFKNNVFNVVGGNLSLINTTVYDVVSNTVISASSGVQSNAMISIMDSHFKNIVGSVVNGVAKCYVYNSSFEKISNYYSASGFEEYNSIFSIKKSIEIYNSIFNDNSMSIVNLNPYYYSNRLLSVVESSKYNTQGRYAYIENSKFTNNVFRDVYNQYNSAGGGLIIHDSYSTFNGYINNCTFTGNKGKLVTANMINSSSFYDNAGQAYGGDPLVKADLINNSNFVGNINRYLDGNGAYLGEGIVSADLILNSIFIKNVASFGGAVSNSKVIHYCVFVNNSAKYSGNDVFSKSEDVDYSSNWWGDNQKPDSNKIFIFLGNLKLDDWIIMSFESNSAYNVETSFKLLDVDGNIHNLDSIMPMRPVQFVVDGCTISPNLTYTFNNCASANLTYDLNTDDFKVSAIIDNQIMDVDVRNSNTRIVMRDVVVKGNNEKFHLDLININGFQISNQTIIITIIDENDEKQVFSVISNNKGHAAFDINFVVGEYTVVAYFAGNGYFDAANSSSTIEVSISSTSIIPYNNTYYGKNNIFYSILNDENGNNLVNFTLVFTISDLKGNIKSIKANTDDFGRADIILNLDLGEFDVKVEFMGDDWHYYSYSMSHIVIKPVNTKLNVPNSTMYGRGNVYNIVLSDVYGNLISGENVEVTITKGSSHDNFVLKTDDKGIAKLTINYVPGIYKVKATYLGDSVYGSSQYVGVIKVERVLTIVSGFHYKTIPLNGIFPVVLSDMYGNSINNETVTLSCYSGKLLKTYSGVTDANGEISFVIDLDEGNYLATIDYGGSIWYDESTNAATIVVDNNAQIESISINSVDLIQYYGENKYFIIKFNDPNAYSQYGKTIVVSISSESWSDSYKLTTDAYGLARLQIKLDPGVYNISYKYSNPYYNIYGNGSNKIYVYKMPVNILSKDLIVKYDETGIYELVLRDINNNPIPNMQINIELDDNEYEVTTNYKGIVNLPINLNLGEYNITYSINNPNYLEFSSKSKILIVDSDKISTKLIANNMELYDNQTLNYVVSLNDVLGNGISSSEIKMGIYTFEGEFVKEVSLITDSDGKAIFNLNLESGKYSVKLTYLGNELYLSSNEVNSINILSSSNKSNVIIFKNDVNIYKNQKFSVMLANDEGILLLNKSVLFIIDNKTYHSMTNDWGVAYLNEVLNPGGYAVKIIVDEDETYKYCSSFTNLNVLSNLTVLHAQKLVKYYKNGTQFHAQLLDGQYGALMNKTIHVVIDGVEYSCKTDENGLITLNINLDPGHYDVECFYYGDTDEEYSFDNTTIDVLSTILGQNEVKYYGQSPYLSIKFLDGAGNPIVNSQFVIGVDGTKYVSYTNSNGTFDFNLNLNPGIHKISVNNPYDGLFKIYVLEILPTIKTNTIVKVLGDNNYYYVFFKDSEGNNLSDVYVDVIINGIKKVFKTNSGGVIKLSMELSPKNYLVTVINPITNEYVEKTIKVLHPITNNKNLVMYYKSNSYFKVRIIGIDGKMIGKGKLVKFTINKKTYSKKTDKNGFAYLKINLKARKYKIITNYKGYKKYNYVTVKPLLTAKNLYKKKGYVKFSAKLVKSNGKPNKFKKIIFKFKNKKYVSKTNSRGIASIKLKLKIGKYSITSNYGKLHIKNKIIIK